MLCHGVWASHYGCFFCCGVRAPGMRASGVVEPRLSCYMVCGTFSD